MLSVQKGQLPVVQARGIGYKLQLGLGFSKAEQSIPPCDDLTTNT